MSYSSQLKNDLILKTKEQVQAPKKNRLKPCCISAFCRAVREFSKKSDEYLLNSSVNKDAFAIIFEKDSSSENSCPDCAGLFLRGAFVTAGSMTDPENRYHLEITLPDDTGFEKLSQMLESTQIPPKLVTRKGKAVFYLKDSEVIEDFLTLIGAQSNALELMQTKVEKNVRNQINRINNSDNANLQRTVYFAGRIADAINLLKQHDMFERLPENLKKTAALRRKYPGASLSELCLYSEEHITKSGLNHRLQKIIEEADKLAATLEKQGEKQ